MKTTKINNIDLDKLPGFVQDVILREFSKLSTKHQLIVYSKLVHGYLFKVTSNDLFNINKQTPGVVYRNFIKRISSELKSENYLYRILNKKKQNEYNQRTKA